MPDLKSLMDQLIPLGQQHLLGFWDQLSPDSQQRLAEQIKAVDFAQIAELHAGDAQQPDWAGLARSAEPPPAMRLADRQRGAAGGLGITPAAARERGEAALAAGQVGVLLVAGGQGSRLGFDHPKGMYPIGPVSGASLLQIHIEKAVVLAQRHGHGVPVYLMTSPVTHDEQLAFLAKHNHFGLAPDDLVVFCQGAMPAVDRQTGQVLLADKDQLFLSPDGHGGTIAALAKNLGAAGGAIDHMRRRGIEHLFYLQVDNPLAPIGDAELIGYHLLAESELTSMAIAKQQPQDKLGNFAMVDGKLNVIEYIDMPDDVAQQTDAEGNLRFWAGSIAVHVFAVEFLQRMLKLKDALPFHIANKIVPHLGEDGMRIDPDEPNALKFERFIFDLLPQAARPIVVEYAEAEVFAPLKNAPGAPKDTEAYVQQFLVDQHRGWLADAGAQVSPDVTVEISPLWALDAVGVAERVEEGMTINKPTYLR